jgi:hypothetical protein
VTTKDELWSHSDGMLVFSSSPISLTAKKNVAEGVSGDSWMSERLVSERGFQVESMISDRRDLKLERMLLQTTSSV